MGAKIKTQKIPGPKFNPQNIGGMRRGNYYESLDCFEYPKKPYLNRTTKKILAKHFSTQKKSRNRKISSLKKSFDHPSHFKSRAPPPPPPPPHRGKYRRRNKIFNPGLALNELSGIGASGTAAFKPLSPGFTKIWVSLGNRM